MSTSLNFIEFVTDQLSDYSDISYRKMFGEYCIYYCNMLAFLVCDDTVFVKKLPVLDDLSLDSGIPYEGSKEHYIVNADDRDELNTVLQRMIPYLKPAAKRRKRD